MEDTDFLISTSQQRELKLKEVGHLPKVPELWAAELDFTGTLVWGL